MARIDSKELEKLIEQSLNDFYKSRLGNLDKLKLKKVLRRKNPYLFKALYTEKAHELIEKILYAYISSSDETIFGDKFFEPIAKIVSGGVVSSAKGVDVEVETNDRYVAYAIKSGPNPFNSSAKTRQNDEFNELRSRLLKIKKQFDPVLAYSYGRKISAPSKKRATERLQDRYFGKNLLEIQIFI